MACFRSAMRHTGARALLPEKLDKPCGVADGLVFVAVVEDRVDLAGLAGQAFDRLRQLAQLLVRIEVIEALCGGEVLLRPGLLLAAMEADDGEVGRGGLPDGRDAYAAALGLVDN